ncbi:MAG: tetratricopeptide repeat protein [Vampirovibrionales bacterium]|nr:tetratricopeptide repeat protein [Vampirovibrionales bacterium]
MPLFILARILALLLALPLGLFFNFPASNGLMAFAADFGNQGISAYKQKNYTLAEKYLTQSLKQSVQAANPKAAEQMFYLGLTYARTNRLEQARQAFEQVLQATAENDPLAQKARNNMTYVTGQQMAAISNSAKANKVVKTTVKNTSAGASNYLAYVITHGRVVHFDQAKMPLKVYIEDGRKVPGWSAQHRQVVSGAYQAWQKATAGKVRFMSTSKKDNADIVVRWQSNFQDNLLGVSPFQMAGNLILRSDVTLALYYPGSQTPIPMAELQAIATHEMGHAIGIKGHSPYASDLMYYARNHKQSATLSSRDINTIKALYKTDADVKNSGTMSTAQTQRYIDLFNQGVNAQKAGQNATAIQRYRQAIALAKTAPEAKYNLALLLMNAGSDAARKNNLALAAGHYKEAESLLTSVLSLQGGDQVSNSSINQTTINQNLAIARKNLQIISANQ